MNNLINTLKSDLKQAILKKDETAKNIFRVTLSECDRTNVSSDDDVQKVIRKMIQNNLDVMKISSNSVLEKENEILSSYIPKMPTEDEYRTLLNSESVKHLILAQNNEGLAMKEVSSYLKSQNIPMNGAVIKSLIVEIRNQ